MEWAEATGKPCSRKITIPHATFTLPSIQDADEQLLPPTSEAVEQMYSEVAHMKAVITLKKIAEMPSGIIGKKYCRLRIPNGQVAGSVHTTFLQGDYLRDYLVRVCSTRRKRARGAEEVVPVDVHWLFTIMSSSTQCRSPWRLLILSAPNHRRIVVEHFVWPRSGEGQSAFLLWEGPSAR